VMADGTRIELPKGHKAQAGQDIVFGIRPEHLDVGPGIKAKVSVTEPTGPEIHIYADVGVDEICAVVRERVSFTRDQVVSFKPQADKIHLFDAATGKAIR
jgi:multiple sugar transport system ATP-binding protein